MPAEWYELRFARDELLHTGDDRRVPGRGAGAQIVYIGARLCELAAVEISWTRIGRITAALLAFWGALIALFAIHRYILLTESAEWISWSESFGGLATYLLGWMPVSTLLLFAAERLPLADERLLRNLCVAILAVIAVVVARIVLVTAVFGDPHATLQGRTSAPFSFDLLRRNASEMSYPELTSAAFYMACFTAWSAHRVAIERARRSDQLQARLARSEFENLRAQLQPHFLFNALNAVTTLIRRNPDAAEATLGHLSDLLRRSLDSTERPLVTLAREIDFVERYIAIQHVRYGERLSTSIDVDPRVRGTLVPSMILQPLVENAIHHSIARREGGSIAISAHADRGGAVIRVTNDGELFAGEAADGFGIGLANARARLAHVFGSDASITTVDAPGSFTVEIHIAKGAG